MMHWDIAAFVFTGNFLLVSALLFLCDVYQPRWYANRAIGERKHIYSHDYVRILPTILLNLTITWILGHVIWAYPSPFPVLTILPAWSKLLACYGIQEMWFYHSHRLIHCKWLFQFHYKHHTFSKPIALSALYSHPVEMIMVNAPLGIVGPWLTQASLTVQLLWMVIVSTYICLNHCGHQLFPSWLIDTSYHDLHHQHGQRRYGSYLLDYLYKTQ